MTTHNIPISGYCPGTPDGGNTNGTMAPVSYTVPAGKIYRVHGMALTSKLEKDPVTNRTMYLEASFGWAVAAHHPHFYWSPPFDLPAGSSFTINVLNGMTEGQNIYGQVMGEELDAVIPPPPQNLTVEERLKSIEDRLAAAHIP